jgi:hypothetical protein
MGPFSRTIDSNTLRHPLMKKPLNNKRRSRRSRWIGRKGAIIVLFAIMLTAVIGIMALALDVGFMMTARTDLQRATDSAALAGAGQLVNGSEFVDPAVIEVIQQNSVGGREVSTSGLEIEVGHWDEETRSFSVSDENPSAVRVFSRDEDQPLFFARLWGATNFDVTSEAIAVFQPRDIMIVLDYSGSMNDDSEFRNISSIGQTAIENNLRQIYTELGSPTYGSMRWTPQYISWGQSWQVKRALGLDRVRYPYPSGSWDDFIRYVQTDNDVRNAGYRKRYGYMTLVNYWLEMRPKYNQTPDLWKTSEQPITAVKDAVSVFLAYIQEEKCDDQVGLAVYTSPSDDALLEVGLTRDMQLVEDTSRQRQAGHYDTMTNIGAGLRVAREEMQENARMGSFKMIVLMTDGVANLPRNSRQAEDYLREQAELCADAGYPVVTVSLGAGADQGLMQEVADITGGAHFNIPGGQTVEEYEEDLKDVFREIAANRPLKLVD